MDLKLELVAIPVSDVDRAKTFYTEKVGFNADHDQTVNEKIRFVQLTPPGSACSISLGKGLVDTKPGPCRASRWSSRTSTPPAPSWSSGASRPARPSTFPGDHSSSSVIRTATAGRCSRFLRATDPDAELCRPTGTLTDPRQGVDTWPGRLLFYRIAN